MHLLPLDSMPRNHDITATNYAFALVSEKVSRPDQHGDIAKDILLAAAFYSQRLLVPVSFSPTAKNYCYNERIKETSEWGYASTIHDLITATACWRMIASKINESIWSIRLALVKMRIAFWLKQLMPNDYNPNNVVQRKKNCWKNPLK